MVSNSEAEQKRITHKTLLSVPPSPSLSLPPSLPLSFSLSLCCSHALPRSPRLVLPPFHARLESDIPRLRPPLKAVIEFVRPTTEHRGKHAWLALIGCPPQASVSNNKHLIMTSAAVQHWTGGESKKRKTIGNVTNFMAQKYREITAHAYPQTYAVLRPAF